MTKQYDYGIQRLVIAVTYYPVIGIQSCALCIHQEATRFRLGVMIAQYGYGTL
jgi:hypothetical protein